MTRESLASTVVHRMLLALVAALAPPLACSSRASVAGNPGAGGAGGSTAGIGGTGGSTAGIGGGGGSTAGAGATGQSCMLGGSFSPTVSTVSGTGFEAWEGQAVVGCFFATQSFGPSCPSTTVVDGGFVLTASVCTGLTWSILVGSGAYRLGCLAGSPATPANCSCTTDTFPASYGYAGASGHGCDAGVSPDGDASNGSTDAIDDSPDAGSGD